MMHRAKLFLLLLLCAVVARADVSPKYEMRGAWLATAYGIDWPSERGTSTAVAAKQKEELRRIITRLHDSGFNAVFFQVRPMADAFYKSSLEPWSYFLTGSRGAAPTYDPLEFCIALCHSMGMECHAWINPLRVGTRRSTTARDIKNSSMWMTNTVGRASMTIFNPALPEVRSHICAVCEEIASSYDIDGIVFDDYFYNPEFLPEDRRATDWPDYVAAARPDMTIAAWRRDNINTLIAEVSSTLSAIKNGTIRFGISPQGIGGGNGAHADAGVPTLSEYDIITADSQYSKIYSDPVSWLRQGLIDYISPQIYWTTDNPRHPYTGLARWWGFVANLFGRHCFPSQTIAPLAYDNSDEARAESLRQVRANRQAPAMNATGSVFYSATHLAGSKDSELCDNLRDSVFIRPALIPPMSWRENIARVTLSGLTLSDDNLLSWDAVDNCRYVIYALPPGIDWLEAISPEGGLSQEYIIAITYTNTFTLPSQYSGWQIAVAPYDRYGYEWEPVFLNIS